MKVNKNLYKQKDYHQIKCILEQDSQDSSIQKSDFEWGRRWIHFMLIEYLLKRESPYLEGIELTVGLNNSGNNYTDLLPKTALSWEVPN